MLHWLANFNFGPRFMFIRRLQCNLFGHNWFTYIREIGWCAWCARRVGKYPKMRERLPENREWISTYILEEKDAIRRMLGDNREITVPVKE